jgi:hypothetical protein
VAAAAVAQTQHTDRDKDRLKRERESEERTHARTHARTLFVSTPSPSCVRHRKEAPDGRGRCCCRGGEEEEQQEQGIDSLPREINALGIV